MDSGSGGLDFIKRLEKVRKDQQIKFVKLFNKPVSNHNKNFVRQQLLEIINTVSLNQPHFIVIACHSASSCILDILIQNNFVINNIPIFEPILPMCYYLKEKKYKKILILSTTLTEKIRCHYRLLNSNNVQIKYITFPHLPRRIDNNNSEGINESIKRLANKKEYLKKCDCVVLGCTHFNSIKKLLSKELRNKYNFNGVILDSNEVLLKYFKKSALNC